MEISRYWSSFCNKERHPDKFRENVLRDVKKLCHELELSLRAAFFIHFGNLRY